MIDREQLREWLRDELDIKLKVKRPGWCEPYLQVEIHLDGVVAHSAVIDLCELVPNGEES